MKEELEFFSYLDELLFPNKNKFWETVKLSMSFFQQDKWIKWPPTQIIIKWTGQSVIYQVLWWHLEKYCLWYINFMERGEAVDVKSLWKMSPQQPLVYFKAFRSVLFMCHLVIMLHNIAVVSCHMYANYSFYAHRELVYPQLWLNKWETACCNLHNQGTERQTCTIK